MMPNSKLISIVEDDAPFRRSMATLLRSLGHPVRDFPSAADFLASPFLASTACLVSDVHMPGMSGVDLHRHLVDAGHAIPTILVTAYPDDAVRARAIQNGVVCFLSKPIDDACLERCLHKALGADPR